MKEYRIVTNGLNYRVQWLGKTLILRRPKWYWLYQNTCLGSFIPEFPSILEAQDAIAKSKSQDEAKKRGYVPITL